MANSDIPCGRLYDPSTDTTTDLEFCVLPARWEIVPRDGISRYACGVHINTQLADLVQDRRVQLAIRDLREGE